MFSNRMGEYQEIFEGAASRMMSGTYRSEHLIEDYFAWCGRAARDITAVAALTFGQFGPGMHTSGGADSGAEDGAGHGRSTSTDN